MREAEQMRQQKLQSELDQARINAGKAPERRNRRESSSDDEGEYMTRSKSVDGRRRRARSKSPGGFSMSSNKSWADLTDEAKLTRNEEKTHMQVGSKVEETGIFFIQSGKQQ